MIRFTLLLSLAFFSSLALAQLKVEVALINIVATVTDERGRYLADLAPEDFVVYEDGQPQIIEHFSQSSDLPVSMGVVLDTSGSMERKIGTAANAVERFIRSIHEDDDVFLMTFGDRPQMRQNFTNDRDKLASVLRRLTVGGGTALYDALDEGLDRIRDGMHEKKAILLISDGEDTASYNSFDQAQLAVRESELLVYCLGIAPANTGLFNERTPIPTLPPIFGGPFPIPGGGSRGGGRGGSGPTRPSVNRDTVDMRVLNAFADASGGKAWLLSGSWTDQKRSRLDEALEEIAAELRNQYSIGYYPPHALKDGKWHRIEIKTKNSKLRVRSRKDYFGG